MSRREYKIFTAAIIPFLVSPHHSSKLILDHGPYTQAILAFSLLLQPTSLCPTYVLHMPSFLC
jgi:hypothetical protein